MFKTGSPLLDLSLGGGLPTGVIEVYGGPSSGKTSLALSIAREAFLEGSPTVFINQESRASPDYIRSHVSSCVYAAPRHGEAAIETAYQALRAGAKVVVIDTTDAIVPLSELELAVGSRTPLAQKRLIYHGFKVLSEECKRQDSIVVATSQVRVNPKEVRPKPKSSFSSIFRRLSDAVLRVQRGPSRFDYGATTYVDIEVRVDRLLGHPPYGTTESRLWSGIGFDRGYELLHALLKVGAVKRAGPFFKGSGISLGPGYDKARKSINSDYSRYEEVLREQISNSGY